MTVVTLSRFAQRPSVRITQQVSEKHEATAAMQFLIHTVRVARNGQSGTAHWFLMLLLIAFVQRSYTAPRCSPLLSSLTALFARDILTDWL